MVKQKKKCRTLLKKRMKQEKGYGFCLFYCKGKIYKVYYSLMHFLHWKYFIVELLNWF